MPQRAATGTSRRRFLIAGASCAAAAASWRIGVAVPPAAGGQESATPPAAGASEETLLVARREVTPAGQRLQGIVANQSFPSYELRAREGERLRVTVENELDQPTALHWHGVLVPNAMDGVPGITQPPIEPRAEFRYELPLREAGTYFYESSWKLQRQLGLVGALVVEEREPRHTVQHDDVLLLSDWTNADPAQVVPELRSGRTPVPGDGDPKRPVNALPDGGAFAIDVRYNAYLLNGRSHRDAWTKQVSPGERVRLRLINGSAATFFRFMVEGHAMQVIAADGRAVEPVEVDDLVLATGERYDVLLTVGQPGSYSLRAAALGASGGAVGVLHTPGVRPVVSTRPPAWGTRHLSYAQLRAPTEAHVAGAPAQRMRLEIGGELGRYAWTVDGVAYPGEFTAGDARVEPLELPPRARVELELVNRTALWQPVHLHGYRFRLLAGQPAARAPWKDTVAVAPAESVKIEFVADAPGRWLLASGNLYRRQAGLARVLTVSG